MEYRCLIAGDAVAEPRMLLQRLLGVPVSESDRRHLRHRSLRDVLLCRATYALLGTVTKTSKKGQHGEEEGDEKGALAVSSAEHNNNTNAEDTRQAFAAGPFTLTMPNPSMPSVDVTILLDLVESPAELEAILRPELPAHGPIAALARTTCMAKRQRFHSAHAVVFAFNPFSHDSVDRARFAWTAALRRCRGALAMNTTAREASLPPYNTTHSAFYDYNAEGNGSADAAPATAATSSGRYKGDVSALSLCSPSFPVSAMAAMNWATPPHTADHYSNTNNNGNQHLTKHSNDDGGDDVMASAALAPRRFDPMAGDIVPYGGACGPTVLLVGTRFDLLAQAVAATPTVMPPAPPTLAELAADMGACLYFEVADTWPERLAELRTRLAQACVGELQERALRVRLEDVSGVRQASMQRAFCELHLSEQDSMAIEGAAEAVAAPEDNRDEELAVSFAWSAQLSFAGPPPANTTTTESATTRAAAVQEVMSGASQRTQAQADAAQTQDTQHAATTDTAHDAARAANGADDARRLRSVWTWRRHPRTGRVYFVHRPTRRTQYSLPPDYDGREPPAAQVSSPSPPSPSYTAAADKRHDALAERRSAACAEDTVEAQADTRHHTRQAAHRTTTTRNEARHHSSHAAHKGKKDNDEDDGEAAALTSHTGHTPGHTRTARPPSSQAPSSPATTVLSIVASTPPAANNHNAAITAAKVVRALLLSSPIERSALLQSEEAAAAAAIVVGGETKGVVSALACLCAAEVRARVALLHALEKGCDEECDGVLHDLQHEVDALRNATRGVPRVMPSPPEDAVGHLHSACADSADVSDQATRSLHEAAAAAQLARYESALCAEEQAAQDALRAARWRYDVWADRLDTQCLVASTRVTRRVPHDAAEHGVSAQASTPHANATRDAVVHALCDGVYAAYRLQRAQEALQQSSRVPASPPTTDTATPGTDGEAGAVPAECVRRVLHEMHESSEGNAHETGSLLSADVLPEAWQRWLIRALQAAALALVRQSSKKQQQQQSSQCATRTSESAQSGTTTTTTPSLDASRYGGVVPLDALQARRAMQEQKVSLWCALRAALRERSEAPSVNSEANREDGHRAFAAAFVRHAAQLEEAVDGSVVST